MHKQTRTLLCPSDSVLPLMRTSPIAMAAFVTRPCCEGPHLSSDLWTWGVSLRSGEGAAEMSITAIGSHSAHLPCYTWLLMVSLHT